MDKLFDFTIQKSLAPLFKDWDKILAVKDSIDFKFILPNYFIELNPEVFIESVVDAVTEKLENKKLLEFKGPVHSYLYYLTYSKPMDPTFTSLRDFYDIFFKDLSGYGEPFKGILAIEITEWVEEGECNSEKFLAFMDFMSSIDDSTLTFFISRCKDKEKNENALSVLTSKSRVRPLVIGEINLEDGYNFVMNYLKELNFSVNEGAEAKLKEVVEFILSVDGNQGIRSLKQFADDLVYQVITKEDQLTKVISEEVLTHFSPTSRWGKTYKKNRKNYLGIIGG